MKRETFIIDDERRRATKCREAGTHKPIEIYRDVPRHRRRTGIERKITGTLPCPNCGSRFSGIVTKGKNENQ
jgi:hypothetical protein